MLLFRKWPYLITHTWFNMNILPFMHPSEIIRFKTSGKHKTYYHHAENNEQIYFLHSDQTLLDQSSGEGNRTSPPEYNQSFVKVRTGFNVIISKLT